MSLSTTNIFAALDTKKKKKTASSKGKDAASGKKKKAPTKEQQTAALEQAIFNAAKISTTNWADTDDEDDFGGDLPESWGAAAVVQSNGPAGEGDAEDEDSEEDDHDEAIQRELGVEFGKDEEEEDEDQHNEEEQPAEPAEEGAKTKPAESEPAQPERVLSKKERKQLELAKLNDVLAELGIDPNSAKAAAMADAAEADPEVLRRRAEKKKKKAALKAAQDAAGGGENGPSAGAAPEDAPGHPPVEGAVNGADPALAKKPAAEAPESDDAAEPAPLLDPAEAKKALLAKKKSAPKKPVSASAAAAAAREAKARALKKGKSKDTSHFNQAPTR